MKKEYETFLFVLEGRADGIVDRKGDVLIDEIKGTFRDLAELKGPDPLHTAQAMCYAWMYMQDHPLRQYHGTDYLLQHGRRGYPLFS